MAAIKSSLMKSVALKRYHEYLDSNFDGEFFIWID